MGFSLFPDFEVLTLNRVCVYEKVTITLGGGFFMFTFRARKKRKVYRASPGRLFFTFLMFLTIATVSGADNFYVSPLGSDTDDGSIEHPWRTLTHALDQIKIHPPYRQNLLVAEGFYEEDVPFKQYVNLYGGYRPDTWERQIVWFPTFIKKPDDSPFVLQDNMNIDGFIIYGGLDCSNASPTINGCRILVSQAYGIRCQANSSPTITNCEIIQSFGCGIEIYLNSSPHIENTLVAMNGADGISMSVYCQPILLHITVADNIAAGIRAENLSNPLIRNSIIYGNNDDLVNCNASYSCIGDGDTGPGNSSKDPLFFGWDGCNEYQPLYVSTYGTDTGNGSPQSPMKYIRQALEFYSYHLTVNSPYIGAGADLKDIGAYPQPDEYLPYFGNVGKILLSPGTYNEQGIVLTVPVHITGLGADNCLVNVGQQTGFLLRGDAKFSALAISGGDIGIHQVGGNLTVENCIIASATSDGILCEGGDATIEGVIFRQSKGNGMRLIDVSPQIRNCQFLNNSASGITSEGGASPQISQTYFASNAIGIYCTDTAAPHAQYSTFTENTQYGMWAKGSAEPVLLMSRIYNNYIGIMADGFSAPRLCSNFIYDNLQKGVKLVSGSRSIIVNNTICYNKVGVAAFDEATAEIRNSILWGNAEQNLSNCNATYSDISGGASGEGNFDVDPAFADVASRDLHITSGSSCIDAGCDRDVFFRDIDGEPRPKGIHIDVGADEAPGVWQFSFADGSQDWDFVDIPDTFTPPIPASTDGSISLTSTNNTDTFGFWQSPLEAIPIYDGEIYHIRFRISGDVDDLSRSPGLRLRVNSHDTQWIDILSVYSQGNGVASPPPEGRDYDLYFVPPERKPAVPDEKNNLSLSFDIVNFAPDDASSATLSLDSVIIERAPVALLPPERLEKRFEFRYGAEGWTTGGAFPYFSLPDFSSDYGRLTIYSKSNRNCFGFWETLVSGMQPEPGRLYRVDFTARTSATPSTVPSLRFRIHSQDFAFTLSRRINSTADASVTLTDQNRVYSLYFVPFEEYTRGELRRVRLACDLINFDRTDDARAIIGIERVEVFSSAIPDFE